MIKVGIMGGTFDPIHIGHLILAMEAINYKNLDEVWFIPTGNPNFKQDKNVTDKQKRFEMVKIATQDNKKFNVCDYEINKNGVTYSWETMKYLRENYDYDFYFIMGEDSLMSVETWENAEDFLKNTKILACIRRQEEMSKLDVKIDDLKSKGYFTEKIPTSFIDISSTKIREKVQTNQDFRYFVPNQVFEYIVRNKLYES
ncbi:MAG: nicotinate-nucleotide adenylyltransferase [Finegoldia magna]|uniref:nicotinate-nucleotide adenylyltransferase n=1 Tax=Finegoldia magna TaxID=1260 RepID=UPI0028042963|nr:nicotinate-nucleotide adenylyltransferase [Finegoldia magna]MDU1400102.1 nicotinate-nucleotide adenylyltransferase [Finegoldia magna]MDU2898050.1 nicotinate-nucleotide adenylyltransferase [Finegoldia magna]MDU5368768.1 nicotinate-nucleotide adenylyltransferase [Finegoldia magna]MDU5443191.1 nicotinate-nucleotide adenylyltransferase [Finegoldia magna]MDU5977133.1 nicotinate-nucleotide adenylyltransferase [Finegoldia magna]